MRLINILTFLMFVSIILLISFDLPTLKTGSSWVSLAIPYISILLAIFCDECKLRDKILKGNNSNILVLLALSILILSMNNVPYYVIDNNYITTLLAFGFSIFLMQIISFTSLEVRRNILGKVMFIGIFWTNIFQSLVFLNYTFNKDSDKQYFQIIEKYEETKNDNLIFYFDLSIYEKKRKISISSATYHQYSVGMEYPLKVHKGWLGIKWIESN